MSLNNHDCNSLIVILDMVFHSLLNYCGFNLICEITDLLHEWVVHFGGGFQ